jgi:hypothetical protein
MSFIRISIVLTAVILFFSSDALALKNYKLRANINPGCATTSTWKYADLYADGNLAVMGSYNCRGVFIFDISNPDAPVLRSWYNPGANLQFLEAIVIGNRGYFGTGNTGGVHIVDLADPANPQLLGIVNASNGGGYPTIHEIMVIDQGGQRYLIQNSNSTANRPLRIINITNPSAAFLVHTLTPGEVNWIHAMHIRGNRMYTSGWGNSTNKARTEIWDIENLATRAPVLLGTITDPSSNVTAGNSMHSSWTSEDGNYLYSAREISGSAANGANAGDIRVYDVSNPATPLLIKKINAFDLNINAVTPHNPVVKGNRLYVSWYQAGTQVFDITNPADPVRIGQYDTYAPEYVPKQPEPGLADEPWDIICGRSELSNFVPTNYDGNWSAFPFLGEDRVLLSDLSGGLYVIDTTTPNLVSDFDGDKKTDISVYRPTTETFEYISSLNGRRISDPWGLPGDIPITADYDGDGRSDPAVYRPSNSVFYLKRSTAGSLFIGWGIEGDIPVVGDFDGDGKADVTVYRPSNGAWYILQSTGGVRIVGWGIDGDKPVAGDYDGDGKADIAVWRPSNGVWCVILSSTSQPIYAGWGMAGDKPVLGDFDGNGKTDFAVYRPSNGVWYIFDPAASPSARFYGWGIAEDVPAPADYDGDTKTDVMVYRPSNGVWYSIMSSTGAVSVTPFGVAGDEPSPASVQPR